MRFDRTKRISEEIKKIVSNLIMNEIKDPRISSLSTVTHVDTTRDLRFTTIFISVFDMNANPNETIEGLNSAKGFIRKEIGHELNLRYTPEPIFKLDESIKNGIYISGLINEVNKDIEDDKDDEDEDQ